MYVFNACCPVLSLQGARCVTRRIHQTARITGPSPLSPIAPSRAEPGCPCRSSCSSGSLSWELKRVRITLLCTSLQQFKIHSLPEIQNRREINVGKKHRNREMLPSSVITLTYIIPELFVVWLPLRLQLYRRAAATECGTS